MFWNFFGSACFYRMEVSDPFFQALLLPWAVTPQTLKQTSFAHPGSQESGKSRRMTRQIYSYDSLPNSSRLIELFTAIL